MTDGAIWTEDLGKRYGAARRGVTTLSETITDAVRRFSPNGVTTPASFWALRHIGLHVGWGEAQGILGDNGAGKTTLLRILSRIVLCTEGRAHISGSVAGLLDCGAALHGELTGRENVRLYASVLGMTSAEIAQRFDSIVSFAEIGRFVDVPVKRYSTGMSLRLSFSVAVHRDPEILLVDDVLGAADVSFQRKCLAKMAAAAGEGRTVVLVSHDPDIVRQFCTRGMVLNSGRVEFTGSASGAADFYSSRLRLRLPDTGEARKEA
jgi:lipopolysaccharide transport system ATP-binding protein